jgi:hypothetical protein
VARKSEWRHAIRVSSAVLAAYALATLLRLPQGYWAVFTAVIIVQGQPGRDHHRLDRAVDGHGRRRLSAPARPCCMRVAGVRRADPGDHRSLLAFLAAVRPP